MKKIHYILSLLLLAALTSVSQLQAQTRITKSGIAIMRDKGHVRAYSPFFGSPNGGCWYTEMINEYKRVLGDSVNVYAMIIPTAATYYSSTSNAREVIQHMYSCLSDSVIVVDLYDALKAHADEEIYARTDHHWLPLGAYYAAEKFAQIAQVPFYSLDQYDRHVVRRFVGTMYYYSKDISVKNDPEDFVYYTPKDTGYVCTYVAHKLDKKGNVLGVSKPYVGNYFFTYKDGSSGAYCTFMGGDSRTTHVKTGVDSPRKLGIIKDSFGNAIPSYLFRSFSDIYVIDFRYFTKNVAEYIKEKGITDFVFANNLSHAYSKGTARKMLTLLKK